MGPVGTRCFIMEGPCPGEVLGTCNLNTSLSGSRPSNPGRRRLIRQHATPSSIREHTYSWQFLQTWHKNIKTTGSPFDQEDVSTEGNPLNLYQRHSECRWYWFLGRRWTQEDP